MNTKTCTKCGKDLPLSSYSSHKLAPDGLAYWCRSCYNAYRKERYKLDNGARARNAQLKCNYGITKEDYDRIWEEQGRGCALCGSDKKPCVDHCHETGRVRGILCGTCNRALGMLGDNLESLRKVVTYLEDIDKV